MTSSLSGTATRLGTLDHDRLPARSPADVRRWATANDIVVSDRGRIPAAVMDRYLEARARGEV